ncbi:MAG: hypothetical protein C0506_03095 [Anaerolinea sp.]|nr:hypothetical protein [Anaerolinea sp.]
MAGINLPMERSAGRRAGSFAVSAPRVVMSWEDWLTFAVAAVAFLAVAVSIDSADWVKRMPSIIPTVMLGLLIGLVSARTKLPAVIVHPLGMVLGAVVVALVVQQYADGLTLSERMADFRIRMNEWYNVVRAGDISNDNLPFITLVNTLGFLSTYVAAWAIYRWHNAWLAIMPGGIVLLANISFQKGQPSGAFVVFLFGAVLLAARLHLQKNQAHWKKEGVEYPEFISVSSVQLTFLVTILLLVFAWMVPLGSQAKAFEGTVDAVTRPFEGQSETLVRLFHNIDSRKGAPLHSFGDTLPIQGEVKLGTKALFEVKSPDAGLLRATSYDQYTGNGWKASDRDSTRVDARELAVDEVAGNYKERTISTLKVTVLDRESTLLTPGMPLRANIATTIETPKDFSSDIERMRSRRGLEKGDTYNSFGSISTASAEQLNGAGTAYPSWVTDRYLQLPKSLPQRVGAESLRVVNEKGARTPYERTRAIEEYLRTFPYDLLVVSAPAGRDTVDFFLFDLKRGYFDYQSTTMAVMLRTLGIPARVAVGYAIDAGAGEETNYTIRKDAAYSWVEVYFPEFGWVTFNPTQDRPEGGAGGLGATIVDPIDPFGEDPSLTELFPTEVVDPFADPELAEALNETAIANSQPPWILLYALAGVLTMMAVLFIAGRMTWNWGLGGLSGRARLWAKAHRLASWAGMGGRAAETPREWSRRVGGAVDRAEEAQRLAEAYEESRYGRPDLQRIDDESAAGSYRQLRGALLSAVLRRKPAKKKPKA